MYAILGHDGPPEGMWRNNLVTDQPLARCPIRDLQLADERTAREVERMRSLYHPLWRQGRLLIDGGIADQPAAWLEAMQYLDALEERSDAAVERVRKQNSGGSE